ncbi:DMT family transporter [Celeribacter arenosi]|uniref:DMT family transporter n=1 Tax=Celeribacter arenosi TaxID=792649 RepID=A0ABP7KGU7_9RHOB
MTAPASQPIKAALWMMGAVFGFSSMAVAGRQLSLGLDTFEIMTYRSLIGIVTVTGLALVTGRVGEIQARALPLHFGRNIAHFAGQNLWLFALTLIPLAQLFALEFSYPILVALGAAIFLGERLTPTRVVTAIVGFAGILIVARPFEAGGLSLGILAAMACAVGFAGSALFTKKLTRTSGVTITQIMFWLSAMQLVFGLICSGIDGDIAWMTWAQFPWVCVISLAGLAAHFSLTTALSLAPASIVTPVDFLRLPLIAVIGMALYNEPLELAVFVGAAIIFGANYANILSESRRSKAT